MLRCVGIIRTKLLYTAQQHKTPISLFSQSLTVSFFSSVLAYDLYSHSLFAQYIYGIEIVAVSSTVHLQLSRQARVSVEGRPKKCEGAIETVTWDDNRTKKPIKNSSHLLLLVSIALKNLWALSHLWQSHSGV
jgi:hypothetical protein